MKLKFLTPVVLLSVSFLASPLRAQDGPPPPPPNGKAPRFEDLPERVQKKLLERFDTNKDGKLDDTEKAAMEKDMQEHRGKGPRPNGPRGQGGCPSCSE